MAVQQKEIAIGAGDLQVQGFKIFFIKRELRMHAFFFFVCMLSSSSSAYLPH